MLQDLFQAKLRILVFIKCKGNKWSILKRVIQAYLGDILGLVPDHHNTAGMAIKRSFCRWRVLLSVCKKQRL